MKYLILIFLAIVTVSKADDISLVAANGSPQAGLMAWFTMEGTNCTEMVGGNLKPYRIGLPRMTNGIVGQGIASWSVASQYWCSNAFYTTNSPITISFWIFPTNTVIRNGALGTRTSGGWYIDCPFFDTLSNSVSFTTSPNGTINTATNSIRPLQWNYIAVVVTNTTTNFTVQMTVNGITYPSSKSAAALTNFPPQPILAIGGETVQSQPCMGTLDNIKFRNYAVPTNQLKTEWNGGFGTQY